MKNFFSCYLIRMPPCHQKITPFQLILSHFSPVLVFWRCFYCQFGIILFSKLPFFEWNKLCLWTSTMHTMCPAPLIRFGLMSDEWYKLLFSPLTRRIVWGPFVCGNKTSIEARGFRCDRTCLNNYRNSYKVINGRFQWDGPIWTDIPTDTHHGLQKDSFSLSNWLRSPKQVGLLCAWHKHGTANLSSNTCSFLNKYMNCFAYPVIKLPVCSANLCKWYNCAGIVTVSYRTNFTWNVTLTCVS